MSKLSIKKIPSRANVQELRAILKSHTANLQSLRKSLIDAREIANKRALEEVSKINMTAQERHLFAKRKADTLIAAQKAAAKETAERLAKDLSTAREILSLGEGSLDNPLAALDAGTLGSSRRATYAQNLVNAGPMSLKNAAERASASNDADLAAAVIAAVSSMPTDKRPFHPAAVLDVFPQEHEVFEPIREFEEAKDALANGLSLYKEVVNGTTSPTGRIERALRAKETSIADEGDEA